MSNRLYSAANFNEAVYRPMKLITKPVVVIAGILLAALVLASTFSVSAQQTRSYRYAENRTDPIATFRADRTVEWTVGGVDAADFDISDSGVLTFKSPPNYEVQTDRDGTTTAGATAVTTDDIYHVEIVASGTILVDATVTVLNVDDLGKATLDHLQPAEDVEFTASVSDEDDGVKTAATDDARNLLDPAIAEWKWERSQSGTSGWSIIAGEAGESYTPKTEDVGYYLRATASYSNRDYTDTTDPNYAANAPVRTASKRSEYPVKASTNVNQGPVFPDSDEDTDGKQQNRAVDENDKNAPVGGAVSARDAGDVLEYSLGDVLAFQTRAADGTLSDAVDSVPGDFNIDEATGQISADGSLNHEAAAFYTVVVTATDPFRATDTVTVTITVNDVNDAPRFTTGSTGTSTGAIREGVVGADGTGETSADNTALIEDDDASTPTVTEAFNYVYTVEDLDQVVTDASTDPVTIGAESFIFLLEGPDGKYFEDGDTDALTLTLAFKDDTKINYETKNSYSVTIVAKDARGKTVEKDVTIRVNNAEDVGKITLSTRQPQVDVPITATVKDEDGIQGSITWLWERAVGDNCGTASAWGEIDNAGDNENRDEKATFTPLTEDVGTPFEAYCLRVSATYTDGFPEDPAPNTALPQVVANPVLPKRQSNRAPRFEDEDGNRITADTRTVAEDSTMVGKAVSSIDPDNAGDGPDGSETITLNDNPTYSLHGADAANFTINPGTGQITAKSDTLDYETKQTHSVVVRATDGSRATTNITVTITVTNVNEKPKVNGLADVTYAENDTVVVGTYTAVDPENDAVTWSLRGPDASKFSIAGGVLSFKSSPNYDTAGDDDENNMYEVTVVATDTVDNEGMKDVDVTVTNVDDPGSISFSVVQPGVGVTITATLNEQDTADEAGSATFQWGIGDASEGPFTDIENATERTYTPDSDDAGKYLQVTAEYGADDNPKSVSGSFDHATADVDVANPVPVFPDQNLVTTDVFETEQDREVAEDAKKGAPVGAPVTASDDDVLTYSIFDGHGASKDTEPSERFTIDQASGQIKVGNANLNYEADDTDDGNDGNLFEVTVTATDANDASADVEVTIIVTDVDEKPSLSTPELGAADNVFTAAERTDAGAGNTEIDADPATTATGIQAAQYTATDQDEGDVVSWSVEGADGDKFTIVNGLLAFDKAPNFEAKGSAAGNNKYKVTIVASDEAGNRSTKNATVNVTDVNETGSIKLSTVQPQVGVPITATLSDPDGVVGTPAWTWTQTGDTSSATGDKASFTPTDTGTLAVTVSYDDGLTDPEDDDEKRTIAAGDAPNTYNIRAKQTSNRAPVFEDDEGDRITRTTREIEENNVVDEGSSNVGLAVQARDPNGTTTVNHLTYTLGGTDADSFNIDRGEPADADVAATDPKATAGQITAKNVLDYEEKSVYTVTVTATDGSGASATIRVTINVTDQEPEDPKLTENVEPEFAEATYAREVVEGTETGRNAGAPVTATDENEDTLSYSLSGDDAASFEIDDSGQITTNEALDLATKDTYTVTVTADDGFGGEATAEVTITLTPAITFDGESATRSIVESSEAGANVGDPVAIVEDVEASYSLSGDDADAFAVDAATGQITVGEETTVDFATKESYSVSVDASAATGGEASIAVTITVTPLPAPVFDEGESASRSVREDAGADANVGDPVTATVTEAGVTWSVTYTLGGDDADSFAIDDTGQITVGEGTSLDAATKDSYSISVTATNATGGEASIDVTIAVSALPLPVFDEGESAVRWVAAGSAAGTEVGAPVTATVTEGRVLYTLGGDDADSFEIGTTTGQITVGEGTELDFETKDSYSVSVNATQATGDATGGQASIDVTIAVANVSASRSVAENSAAGTAVGDPVTLTSLDLDVTYSLGGDDAESFAVDSETGQITVGEGTTLDFEARDSYSVSVNATDATGGEVGIAVAIAVENVNEPGTLTLSSDAAAFGEALSATLEDPDGGISDVSWEWQWSELGSTWVLIPGGLTASYTPTETDGGLLLRVVVEYSDAAGSATIESGAVGPAACAATAAAGSDADTGTTAGTDANTGTTTGDANTGTDGNSGTYGNSGTTGANGNTGTTGANGDTGTGRRGRRVPGTADNSDSPWTSSSDRGWSPGGQVQAAAVSLD